MQPDLCSNEAKLGGPLFGGQQAEECLPSGRLFGPRLLCFQFRVCSLQFAV